MMRQKPQPRTRRAPSGRGKRPSPYARAAASRAQWEMVDAVREQRRADLRDPERMLSNYVRTMLARHTPSCICMRLYAIRMLERQLAQRLGHVPRPDKETYPWPAQREW